MIRKTAVSFFILFLLANLVAFMHAYRFTHFSKSGKERTKDPKELSAFTKAKILFTGIENPKPSHTEKPSAPFSTVMIKSDVNLEAWHIQVNGNAKGTVILFHGYSGEKSSLLERSAEFRRMGYSTLLVDFMGSGGSEGESTHLGYSESQEVKDCYEYLLNAGEKQIHLFGTSMGAVAILKAIHDHDIRPMSIILECPFGSLYQTVSARFRMMHVPAIPLSAMLTFWGGVQQGYWAFSHNPSVYASSVDVPTLLLYGELDDRVSLDETLQIYNNLQGHKVLVRYPEEGHALFTETNHEQWKQDVDSFLSGLAHP